MMGGVQGFPGMGGGQPPQPQPNPMMGNNLWGSMMQHLPQQAQPAMQAFGGALQQSPIMQKLMQLFQGLGHPPPGMGGGTPAGGNMMRPPIQ